MNKLVSTVQIDRFVGDTYPVSQVIDINGIPVDLEGWDIRMHYTETPEIGESQEVQIVGIVTDKVRGVVKFYPRSRYTTSYGAEYTPFTVAGTHDYSIVRTAEIFELDPLGTYVKIDGAYVSYDAANPAHAGLPKFGKYYEVMTHAVGKLVLTSRSGFSGDLQG